jgi:hypothetical protein
MQELVEQQRAKTLICARRIVSNATSDDLLQPNDFPQLELSPSFRHEEGILDGFLIAQTAILRLIRDSEGS